MNPRVWLNKLRPMPSGKNVVIVAGMPKSGTTAIASLLAAATGEKVCSDPFYQLDQKKIIFREDLYNNSRSLNSLWMDNRNIFFSGKIIKDPNFPFFIFDIQNFLPKAQFVSIVRDPRDNLRSVLNRLNLPGKPLGVNLESANISTIWLNVLKGNNPKIQGQNYIEILAWRWRMSAEAFLKHRSLCVEIRYEDFKSNKAGSIANLAKQLGYVELHNIDHLVDVQYQPRGNSNVEWSTFFGEKYLNIIENITGPVMREFGYVPVTSNK